MWKSQYNVFRESCKSAHFSQTTVPQQVIFKEGISTVILLEPCEFNVNLWMFCVLCRLKSIQTLKGSIQFFKISTHLCDSVIFNFGQDGPPLDSMYSAMSLMTINSFRVIGDSGTPSLFVVLNIALSIAIFSACCRNKPSGDWSSWDTEGSE